MVVKKIVLIAFSVFLLSGHLHAQADASHPDSVVNQVFRALTSDKISLPKDVEKNLIGPEWEALAYWDTAMPKLKDYMQEAVGDIYKFNESTFTIRIVDPNNTKEYLSAITGTFVREDNILHLTAKSGKKLGLIIILLDEHYLILELDGLRIFFTKTRSFNTH